MEFLKEIKTTYFILSGFHLVLGLSMLIAPEIINNIACYLIGAICLITGGIAIYTYMASKVYGYLANAILTLALIFISLGLFIFFNPKSFTTFIPLIIGLVLVIDSFCKLQSSMTLKKYNHEKWKQILIVALLVFVLGIILIINPFATVILLLRILGLTLIIDGISSFLAATYYTKIEKAIKE